MVDVSRILSPIICKIKNIHAQWLILSSEISIILPCAF